MAELKYAKDLELDYATACRFVCALEEMSLVRALSLDEQIRLMSARREVARDERIDALMGENTALEAKIARLENERDAILEAVTQICPAFEIQSITARVLAARGAEPANGAKENNESLVTIVHTQPAAQKEGKGRAGA